jgi:hypothetical protein
MVETALARSGTMTLGSLAFAVLVWGSLAAVVAVVGYLLRVLYRETEFGIDSSGRNSEDGT